MELKDIVEKGIFEKVEAEEGELTALKILHLSLSNYVKTE